MFKDCTSLTNFDAELPVLTDGSNMFDGCTSLTNFNAKLPALTDGRYMFYYCRALTSFTDDLPALTIGTHTFCGCSMLTSFTGSLPALSNGYNMFSSCKLDLASVQNIANTINNLAAQSKTGKITIGMQKSIQGSEEVVIALATIRDKGWTITEQYN